MDKYVVQDLRHLLLVGNYRYICLRGQDLAGKLPPSLAKLLFLKTMSLENFFDGIVPRELGKLVNLENLSSAANLLHNLLLCRNQSAANSLQMKWSKFAAFAASEVTTININFLQFKTEENGLVVFPMRYVD
ncbi:hypothetical protein LguiB_021799 [Lonicera macranthoides]